MCVGKETILNEYNNLFKRKTINSYVQSECQHCNFDGIILIYHSSLGVELNIPCNVWKAQKNGTWEKNFDKIRDSYKMF